MPDDNLNANAHKTGEFIVMLGDQRLPLKRTMGALRAFNNAPGGLIAYNGMGEVDNTRSTVTTRLMQRDLGTAAFIIRTGLGMGPTALPSLDQQLFDLGIEELVTPLLLYLFMLRTKPGTPIPGVTPEEEVAKGEGDPQMGTVTEA